jgi:hypothetical protein
MAAAAVCGAQRLLDGLDRFYGFFTEVGCLIGADGGKDPCIGLFG